MADKTFFIHHVICTTRMKIITKIMTEYKICSHLWTAVYNRVPTFFI
jgi:hypothetical protein